jgi:MoaA/NifB/PqqE/SkfB family radical SAM enzyme
MDIDSLVKECQQSPVNAWARGKERTKAPWLCYINLTNLCNNRCRVCAHPLVMRPAKGLMSFAVFRRVVDQLPPEVSKVYLQKQGEPLLHPQLEQFLAYLRRRRPDLHVAFHTNAILARKERMARLLPLLNSLGVSVSATSAPIYKEVHGTGAFAPVMRNLAGISELLGAMEPASRPHVFIDYVSQRANAAEDERQVVQFFQGEFPNIPSVDLHWVYNFQGEIAEGNLDVYDQVEHSSFPCCVFPWSSITFCHDGQVSYCFVEPRENLFLGDITRQTFTQIWQGEAYRRFRRNMAAKRFGALAQEGFYCHKCSWLWSMRSQSPRNLAGGYSARAAGEAYLPRLGDLLDWPQEKVFLRGVELYRQGELAQALSCFELLGAAGAEGEVLRQGRRMSRLCRQGLAKFADVFRWRELMERRGTQHQDRECRYYSREARQS